MSDETFINPPELRRLDANHFKTLDGAYEIVRSEGEWRVYGPPLSPPFRYLTSAGNWLAEMLHDERLPGGRLG